MNVVGYQAQGSYSEASCLAAVARDTLSSSSHALWVGECGRAALDSFCAGASTTHNNDIRIVAKDNERTTFSR